MSEQSSAEKKSFGSFVSNRLTFAMLVLAAFFIPLAIGQVKLINTVVTLTSTVAGFPNFVLLLFFAVTGLLFWFITGVCASEGLKIRWSPVFIPLACFLAWATVSTIVSPWSWVSLFGANPAHMGLLTWYALAILCFLVVQEVTSMKRMRVLLMALCATSALIAALGIAQSFWLDPLGFGSFAAVTAMRSSSVFGNPNHLSSFLAISVFLCAGLALSEKNLKLKILLWGSFLLNCWCLMTAMTRGAWVAAILSGVVFVLLLLRGRFRLSKIDIAGIALTVLACAIVLLVSTANPIPDVNAGDRISSLADPSSSSITSRFSMWESAVQAVGDAPLMGRGLDTYRFYSAAYSVPAISANNTRGVVVDNPHNIALVFLLETGIPGLLALLAFVVMLVLSLRTRGIWKKKKLSAQTLVIIACLCGCLASLLYLMVGLAAVGTWAVLFILFGIMLAPTAKTATLQPGKARYALAALLVVLSCGAYYGIARMTWANVVFRAATRGDDIRARLDVADETLRINPLESVYRRYALQISLNRALTLANERSSLGPNDAKLEEARYFFERAVEYGTKAQSDTPDYFENYLLLASAYNGLAMVDGPETWAPLAMEQARRAIELQKEDYAGTFELAFALYLLGDTEQARSYVTQALEVNPYFESAQLLYQALGQ